MKKRTVLYSFLLVGNKKSGRMLPLVIKKNKKMPVS